MAVECGWNEKEARNETKQIWNDHEMESRRIRHLKHSLHFLPFLRLSKKDPITRILAEWWISREHTWEIYLTVNLFIPYHFSISTSFRKTFQIWYFLTQFYIIFFFELLYFFYNYYIFCSRPFDIILFHLDCLCCHMWNVRAKEK